MSIFYPQFKPSLMCAYISKKIVHITCVGAAFVASLWMPINWMPNFSNVVVVYKKVLNVGAPLSSNK